MAEINAADAREDPATALNRAIAYLKSVLQQASHRNGPAANGWRWAVVHIIDALAVAIERGAQPHPWFRDRRAWHLNPAGWAPLAAVVETFRALTVPPGQEDSR